jgi:CLIP-associating protein 1/2
MYPKTPMNGYGGNVWEDSPGPTAVTPLMVDKLKGRRHERSWWLKRQQCRYLPL